MNPLSMIFMSLPMMFGSNFLSSLGSGLASSIFQSSASEDQFEYAMQLQKQAQAHQEYMYKHQHQWRVDDLRAAGLNPILSTHSSSAMPSAPVNGAAAYPVSSAASPFNFDSFAKILSNRYKKENNLLDAQMASAKASVEANLSLAEKYSAEAFATDLNSAFEYSRDMLNLKKRRLFNEGTPDLYKGFGLFKEEVDKFNNYKPWHFYDAGNSIWDVSASPFRTGRNRFFYKK